MRALLVSFLKRLLGIHHQSGVKPLAAMRAVGWRRHSYWVPEALLGPESVCYCIGAGEDISFDVELQTLYGCRVVIFDPTPYGIHHFEDLRRHVAAGTPPTLAIVSPMNIVATALACFSRGTRLAATTEPSPKNAPWLRLVTSRASSSVV